MKFINYIGSVLLLIFASMQANSQTIAYNSTSVTFQTATNTSGTVTLSGNLGTFVLPNGTTTSQPYNMNFCQDATGSRIINHGAANYVGTISISSTPLSCTALPLTWNGTYWIVGTPVVTYNTSNGSSVTNPINGLTGDVTASGPGSAVATLATVNPNVGTFGSATTIPIVSADAKGRVTGITTATISPGVTSANVTGIRYSAGASTTDTAATSSQLVTALNTNPTSTFSTSLIPALSYQPTGNYLTALTGDCTATGPGSAAITCTKTNGTAFGTFASQNYATPPVIGATTPNIVNMAPASYMYGDSTTTPGRAYFLTSTGTGLTNGITSGAGCWITDNELTATTYASTATCTIGGSNGQYFYWGT